MKYITHLKEVLEDHTVISLTPTRNGKGFTIITEEGTEVGFEGNIFINGEKIQVEDRPRG